MWWNIENLKTDEKIKNLYGPGMNWLRHWPNNPARTLTLPSLPTIGQVQSSLGPLYGNRISFQSSLDAVECYHSKEIEEHIKDICERKDAEALEDWRGFYKRKLIGLDKSALEIIQKNSHLIHDDDSRVTLRNFLKAVAKQGKIFWWQWRWWHRDVGV